MVFTLETLGFLASDAGSRALERLSSEDLSDANTLRLLTTLRRDLPPEHAGAALELARLRLKAVDKFGADAARMFFTREALEQASDPLVRRWRAREAAALTGRDQPALDVCSSIGSDALAFAAAGLRVTGIDIDPVRVLMARLNADALRLTARFETADARDYPLEAAYIFFDPARRDANGRRIFDVEQYQPPLSLVNRFQAGLWGAKLSPGVDTAQLDPYLHAARLDFISVNGDLKEAQLSHEADEAGGTRAILLTGEQVLIWEKDQEVQSQVSEPRAWLVEPDPALIRAGLVAHTALAFGGAQLDETIAYITTDSKPESPWARAWQVEDWMPFNLKRLRAHLRERGVGRVTVKKRGTAVTPEELLAKLKLNGSGSRTLVLTRCRGEYIVVICRDLTTERGG